MSYPIFDIPTSKQPENPKNNRIYRAYSAMNLLSNRKGKNNVINDSPYKKKLLTARQLQKVNHQLRQKQKNNLSSKVERKFVIKSASVPRRQLTIANNERQIYHQQQINLYKSERVRIHSSIPIRQDYQTCNSFVRTKSFQKAFAIYQTVSKNSVALFQKVKPSDFAKINNFVYNKLLLNENIEPKYSRLQKSNQGKAKIFIEESGIIFSPRK